MHEALGNEMWPSILLTTLCDGIELVFISNTDCIKDNRNMKNMLKVETQFTNRWVSSGFGEKSSLPLAKSMYSGGSCSTRGRTCFKIAGLRFSNCFLVISACKIFRTLNHTVQKSVLPSPMGVDQQWSRMLVTKRSQVWISQPPNRLNLLHMFPYCGLTLLCDLHAKPVNIFQWVIGVKLWTNGGF